MSSPICRRDRQAGGLPMVIPMGDRFLGWDYVETIDQVMILSELHLVCGLASMAKKNHQAMITISNAINLSPTERSGTPKQTGSENFAVSSSWSMAFGGTLNQEIERALWHGLPFWDFSFYPDKKVVWWSNSLDQASRIIIFVKYQRISRKFPCDRLWSTRSDYRSH